MKTPKFSQSQKPKRLQLKKVGLLEKSPSNLLTAGVDEAGRGAWAGPVVAAAVIWPDKIRDSRIQDSKQLSPQMREQLFSFICEHAVAVGVGVASAEEIDGLGIVAATHAAMQRAVDGLKIVPEMILVDGYRVGFRELLSEGVIKGDSKYIDIAAASIVAKVTRDRIMVEMDNGDGRYGFAIHKGYGTALHQRCLDTYGASGQHRRSFAPVAKLLGDSVIPAQLTIDG